MARLKAQKAFSRRKDRNRYMAKLPGECVGVTQASRSGPADANGKRPHAYTAARVANRARLGPGAHHAVPVPQEEGAQISAEPSPVQDLQLLRRF